MQELLLREKTLDLARAVDICRVYEMTSRQTKEMSGAHVDKVSKHVTPDSDLQPRREQVDASRPQTEKRNGQVSFVGIRMKHRKPSVQPGGTVCRKCEGRNHFQAKCRTRVRVVNTRADTNDIKMTGTMTSANKGIMSAVMRVNECDVRFHLHSGADVNTICKKFVRKHQLQPAQQKLTMWNGSTMYPVGEAVLEVQNPKTSSNAPVRFTVVDNGLTCLLGVDTIQELGLITVNTNAFVGNESCVWSW